MFFLNPAAHLRPVSYLVDHVHRDRQALAGRGLLHQVLDDLDRVEDHPLARPGHVREEPVLDRVVLRAVRRVVRHPHLQFQPV